MNLTVTLFKCSGCSFWAKYQSEIQKHCKVSSACINQVPLKDTFELDFRVPVDFTSREPVARQKPGAKPLDIEKILRGRELAFTTDQDDDIFDRRVDYLFETEGLIDKCMRANLTADKVPERLVNIFSNLWGNLAPKEFQSIIMYRGKVYQVEGTLSDGGIDYIEYPSITMYFNDSDFLQNFLDSVNIICTESVHYRRPELQSYARHILDWIESPKNMLTVRDVFLKNDAYYKHRKTAKDVVGAANRIMHALKRAIELTTISAVQNTT
jgi:hypothetical protein